MAKITVEGQVYEGTPGELRELFEMMGVKFPVEEVVELKVDDYVRVVNNKGHYQNNTIVKIVEENWNDTGMYDTKNLDGSGGDIHYAKDFEKVTEEEVAQAKAELESKQAEDALHEKWAKIGRKPNEFKKGDIVRLNTHSGAHDIGTIVFVIDDEYGNYRDEKGEFWGGEFSWYELIAPVESRFDKESE